MGDLERLRGYVDVWWRAVGDFLALIETLPDDAWHVATDLPGWDVHDCVAHTAHLEAVLSGAVDDVAAIDPPEHVRNPMGAYTEQGVVARRDRTAAELIDELRSSATLRLQWLRSDPPSDGAAPAEPQLAGLDWSWETLLRNRPLDVWMHEQDVRRAVDRPGGLDSPAALHTTGYLLEAMGMVLARRAGAPAGTTLVVDVEGSPPAAFGVSGAGRGVRLEEVPTSPTVRLCSPREDFVVLAGGRRSSTALVVEGDADLVGRLLRGMAVTP